MSTAPTRSRKPNRRLRDIRAKKKLSQEKLARRAGVALGTINKAETGQQVPHAVTQEKIARALGVPRDVLFPEEAA